MRPAIGCLPLRRLLLMLTLYAVSGCSPQPDHVEVTDDRDSVLAILDQMDERQIRTAFEFLAELDHRRHVTIHQIDGDGNVIAMRSQEAEITFRNGSRSIRIVGEGAEGEFDFGIFGRFVPGEFEPEAFAKIEEAFLPAQPALLRPRAYEDFIYRMAGDTLIAGERLSIIDVRARPGAEDDYDIARARYYFDPETYQLRRMDQWRRYDAILFSDIMHSTFEITAVGDRYVPARATSVTSIRAPLLPRRRFTAETVYSFNVAPAPGA